MPDDLAGMAVKLSGIKLNPRNPRVIKGERFEALKAKIQRNPNALKVRPIVIESRANPIIIGGNQRYKALKDLGYKEVPDEWIQSAEDWTEEQRREFLVNDNVADGDWEMEMLLEDYDEAELTEWGFDLLGDNEEEEEPTGDDLLGDAKAKPATMKITFASAGQLQKAEADIQELLDRKYPDAYFSVKAGEL